MDEIIKINETESYLDKYINDSNLQTIAAEKLSKNDIVILPAKYSENEYYFAQETIDFVKFCRSKSNTGMDILTDGDIQIRSLHSFDIWLPIIFIASNILLPAVINLVTSFIYDKMKGREHEKVKVNVEIVIKNGKKEKQIHYDGDAESFKTLMDKIDLNI